MDLTATGSAVDSYWSKHDWPCEGIFLLSRMMPVHGNHKKGMVYNNIVECTIQT